MSVITVNPPSPTLPVEPHPSRRGRLVIGSACSGHGFKFAPAVGRRLADLALG